jgi:hypothetical protein
MTLFTSGCINGVSIRYDGKGDERVLPCILGQSKETHSKASKVFKGVQRYSKVFKGIQRYSKIT